MKKAWDDIKSFITVSFVVGYLVLTFLGKMTPEYEKLTELIIVFYFGTQAEKLANKIKESDNNGTSRSDGTN